MGTLWNTYAFYILYAEIDGFDPTKYTLDYDQLPVMDKWLLSIVNSAVKEVDDDLNNYKIPEAARALADVVEQMSNWYVRRTRERFWAKGMEQDKINAYMTLYTALVNVIKAAAPMVPFITEEIYQNMVKSVDASAPESIHLCDFPVANEAHIDKALEQDMDEVRHVVTMGHAARNAAAIKNRQPIGQMFVKAEKELSDFYVTIIEEELNVKKLTFTQDTSDFTTYSFKPQLRTVGPKYGKVLGQIKEYLSNVNGDEAMAELKSKGAITFTAGDTEVSLAEEDLLIETEEKGGFVTEADNKVTVVLDTNLTDELIKEGFVYEVISKIQNMRKDSGFEVMDHIRLAVNGNDKIAEVIKESESDISTKVLAETVLYGEVIGNAKEWNINGEKVTLSLEKV